VEVDPEVKLTGPLAVILKSGDVEPANVNAVVEMEMQETAKLSTNIMSGILPPNRGRLRAPLDGPNKS
jgi:hypothetical protein